MVEKKPFVRYRITADIKDKGIAFNIKKAIRDYLHHHQLEGKISDFVPTSDRVEAVMELYDNGNYDLNMRALREHLQGSGRLPSKAGIRPEVITIVPIPIDEIASALAASAPDENMHVACIKTMEDLNERILQRDNTIQALSQSTAKMQEAIDALTRDKSGLEKRVSSVRPMTFDDPLTALINSYVVSGEEAVIDAGIDLEALEKLGAVDYAISRGSAKNLVLFDYLNHKSGGRFSSADEYNTWVEQMKSAGSWDLTEQGKRLEAAKKRAATDSELLKMAEDKGASPEVVEALKKAASSPQKVEEEIAKSQAAFDSDRSLFYSIPKIEENFKQFSETVESINERRKAGTILPVLVHSHEGFVYHVVVPTVGNNNSLEKYLSNKINAIFTGPFRPTTLHQLERVKQYSFAHNNMAEIGAVQEGVVRAFEGLEQDPVLNSLGLSMRVSYLFGNRSASRGAIKKYIPQ